MYLTPDVHTVVGTQWDVTRVVLTTPELDEGAVFVREGDRWRETMEETSTRFGSLRRLDDVRVRWSGGLLHVQCPKSAEVLLLVPDPEGIPVTEGSTFLEGGPLPEGAHVLLGGCVRIRRYRGPVVLEIPFETARESIVSVRWIEGTTYYEYTDWAAHDWDRRFRPAFLLPALVSCVRRCG
ncbi:TPA: hypothetical protein HA336_00755 [Methanopyrus kandleri]|nr:hypothetical protein [Methanopyrus kandleri]